MTCDRCEDIHIAQRAGKQTDECKCSCHKSITQPWHWSPQPYYYTGDPIPPQGETICSNDLFREFKKKDDIQ